MASVNKKVIQTLFGLAVLLTLLTLTAPCQAGRDWTLAEDGRAFSAVIAGEDSGPIEKHAAEELSRFLSAVTGAEISVHASPVEGKYPLWIGTPANNPRVAEAGLSGRVEAISGQGFLIYSDEGGLVITGSTPLGVLYGAYAFLEEYVGMRWYFPGEHGEYRPEIPKLYTGRIDDLQEPAFSSRTVAFSRVGAHQYTRDTWDWISRNRLQPRFHPRQREEYEKRGARVGGGGHILHRMVPDELFDDNPEYFALYDGERKKQQGHRGQPCTTHPEVVNLAVEYMLEWFSENPGGRFTINNNDYPNFCECDNCTALDPPGEATHNIVATRFFRFKDEVARRVWEVYPEARIHTLAYQRFRMPPTAFNPDPRLWVILCDHGRCFRHSLADPDCEANAWFREMFEGWAEFENRRGYFPYYNMIGGRPEEGIISVPLEHVVSDDMRYMHGLGHEAWNLRVRPPDASYAGINDTPATRNEWRGNLQWYYIQAKLAWDIDLDVDELLAEFHDRFYGEASEPMARYHEYIRTLWEETPGHFMYGTPFEILGKTMVAPGAEARMRGLLEQAAAAVEGHGIYAERVAKDRGIFERGWVLARAEYGTRSFGEVEAARRTGEIKIDGKLDEPDWLAYERVTGFVRRDGGEAEAQTYVRILYDDDYIYLGLEMEEPLVEELVSAAYERDSGRIWNDDTVQIFIDPEGEGLRYVHLTVNPGGVLRDSDRPLSLPPAGDVTYRSDAEIASHIGDSGWSVEMKVSAESLGGEIIEGGRWLMDIGRSRKPEREISSWADGAFHRVDNFRPVAFSRSIIKNGRFDEIVVLDTEQLLRRHGHRNWEYGNEPPMGAVNWSLHGGYTGTLTVLGRDDARSGEHAVRIEGDSPRITQRMDAEFKEGEEFIVSFSARGEGMLRVTVVHYERPDPESARIRHFANSRLIDLDLRDEWQDKEIRHVHPEGYPEVAVLAFHAFRGKADLDSISVVTAPAE